MKKLGIKYHLLSSDHSHLKCVILDNVPIRTLNLKFSILCFFTFPGEFHPVLFSRNPIFECVYAKVIIFHAEFVL